MILLIQESFLQISTILRITSPWVASPPILYHLQGQLLVQHLVHPPLLLLVPLRIPPRCQHLPRLEQVHHHRLPVSLALAKVLDPRVRHLLRQQHRLLLKDPLCVFLFRTLIKEFAAIANASLQAT